MEMENIEPDADKTARVQTDFMKQNQHLITLAFMEYTARVIPVFMKIELQYLQTNFGMTHYFEHTPLACDEFR